MTSDVDESARIVGSCIGETTVREFVTIHDTEVGDGCRIYEHSSIKKSRLADDIDVNAGSYVENAEIGPRVQLGPNSCVVGVTHELTETGMTFREDVFERVVLHEGAFVGAGAVVAPGVELGAGTVVAAGATVTGDVGEEMLVLGSPPAQAVVPLAEWLRG